MKILFDLSERVEMKNMNNYDSGFGNRIFGWAIAYMISDLIENTKIILQYSYWPELLLLDFPKTSTKKLSKSDQKKIVRLTFDDIEYLLKTKDSSFLNSEKIYSLNAKFFSGEKLISIFGNTWDDNFSHVISKIKFKKPEVESFFKEKFSDTFWIHMRRGIGTIPTEKFLVEMSKVLTKRELKSYWDNFHFCKFGRFSEKKYQELLDNVDDRRYQITSDQFYFKLIDDIILKTNEKQKIYISSDIPSHFYRHYFEKYKKNIINKDLRFKEFLQFYKNEYFIIQKEKLKMPVSLLQVLYNVFDLFVGISSPSIIMSYSSWSFIVQLSKRIVSEEKKYMWLHGDSILENNMNIVL